MLAPQRILTGLLSLQSYLPSPLRFASNTTLPSAMDPDISRVNDFWYSRPTLHWFVPPEGLDHQCRAQFSDLVHSARQGKLDHWLSSPNGTLAILILLDQFSRNIYRGTPDAFSADRKALSIATHAIAKGWDKNTTVAEAVTYYLPLMHNESLLAQVACISLIEQRILQTEPGSPDRKFLEDSTLSSAKQHLEIIEKFGRYPSRNAILGRESTPEEKEHLRENPEGFTGGPPDEEGKGTGEGGR